MLIFPLSKLKLVLVFLFALLLDRESSFHDLTMANACDASESTDLTGWSALPHDCRSLGHMQRVSF
eukprot:8787706-Pyramimonas_sp.AAC.1